MGNRAPQKAADDDPFFADSLIVPAMANLKRDPTQKLGIGDNTPRGLLGTSDERKMWGVFEDENLSTHANSTVVIEAKWECDDIAGVSSVIVLGSGVLIGDLSKDASGLLEKTEAGYVHIASEWILTAGHCIFHPQKGLAQEVRVRIPNVMKYQENRSKLPMLDGADPGKNERFLTVQGMPIAYPRFVESPDSLSGQDVALIRLTNVVQRIGLPLRDVPFDYVPDVLAIGGYPAQQNRCYHIHVSSSRYVRLRDQKDVDTKFKFNGIDDCGEGFAMVRYSNQATPGQSGGPISAYTDGDEGDRPGTIIGIHCNEDDRVSGENSGTLLTESILNWIVQTQRGDSRSPQNRKSMTLREIL